MIGRIANLPKRAWEVLQEGHLTTLAETSFGSLGRRPIGSVNHWTVGPYSSVFLRKLCRGGSLSRPGRSATRSLHCGSSDCCMTGCTSTRSLRRTRERTSTSDKRVARRLPLNSSSFSSTTAKASGCSRLIRSTRLSRRLPKRPRSRCTRQNNSRRCYVTLMRTTAISCHFLRWRVLGCVAVRS